MIRRNILSPVFVLLFYAGALGPGLQQGQTMEVAELNWRNSGHSENLTVFWDEIRLRIDQPEQRFSLIYQTQTSEFIGLEHRDGRYWTFNWLKLSQAVERSRQSARGFRDLPVEGAASVDLLRPEPTPETKPLYLWKSSPETRTLRGVVTHPWLTHNELGRPLQLWCGTGAGTASRELWQKFVEAQEILNFVAVRNLGPKLPPLALKNLPPEAGTPLEFNDDQGEDTDHLILRDVRQLPRDAAKFVPPIHYQSSPLNAIEGLQE